MPQTTKWNRFVLAHAETKWTGMRKCPVATPLPVRGLRERLSPAWDEAEGVGDLLGDQAAQQITSFRFGNLLHAPEYTRIGRPRRCLSRLILSVSGLILYCAFLVPSKPLQPLVRRFQ